MRARVRRHAASLIIALAICLLIALARSSGALQRFENLATDACARFVRHTVAADIVIVGIDELSLAELSSWPWPRSYHARLLNTLFAAQPRAIFLDVDFSSPAANPADDAALEEALDGHGRVPVILPEFFQPRTAADGEVRVTQPLERLARHVTLGSVNLQPDVDGLVRRIPLTWSLEGVSQPTAVAQLAPPPLWHATAPSLLIDYSISPESFGFVSYAEVLAGHVRPTTFAGKTVLVGATALELHDLVAVPLYRSLPGVVVQALALQSLRSGPLRAAPNGACLLALVLWTWLLVAVFDAQSWRRNVVALPIATAALVAVKICGYAAHQTEIEVLPGALALVATFTIAIVRSLDEQSLRALTYALGLRRRDALLRSIVESSTDCILCIDAAGVIQTANPAAARLFGEENAVLHGTLLSRYLPALAANPAADTGALFEALCGTISEWEARTVQSRVHPVEISFGRAGIQGEALFTVIIRDVSERKEQQRQLEFRATHDALTSLPNRAALDTRLAALLGRAERPTVALLMLDLCRFKEVNDTLGHSVGDAVLQEVARRFVTTIGERGIVARIGGDEFVVVPFDTADATDVVQLAEALAHSLRAPIDLGGVSIDVGVSTGIAFYPGDASDGPTLLRHADVAMYLAKRRGTLYERYDAAHDGHTVRKLTMVSELRTAIACGGLELHYQPQVDLHRGTSMAVEGLLRWEHPTLGKVSPAEFVGIAESTDLIRPLTEFTLREALAQLARWRSAGLELRVAVNLSARMLHDPDLARRLANLLAMGSVAPTSLEVEVTESAVMLDPARALRSVREIRELGVLVAIDDYGTGFSGLNYLRDLPAHLLKLDKSFVQGMRTRQGDRVIVESTIRMAHALHMHVVAEGVESETDARLLAQLGCDFAQGYHYSRPLTGDVCAEWIRYRNAAVNRLGETPADREASVAQRDQGALLGT
jgi:diguanylate cyclase (GGDEF)-like protein/PAS domain S-box-containing protein